MLGWALHTDLLEVPLGISEVGCRCGAAKHVPILVSITSPVCPRCRQDLCPGCSRPARAPPGDGTSQAKGGSLHADPRSPYLGVDPLGAGGGVLHPAVEVDGQHVLGTGFLPGVAVPEPVVGFFHLPEGER